MPRTNKDRIEIYLSHDSSDDIMLSEIWKTLSSSGRGRAQAFFRRALVRGMKTMRSPDIPGDIGELINTTFSIEKKKRGPKKKWEPTPEEEKEIENEIIKNDNLKEKTDPPVPKEILDEYHLILEEQEPTPETLGFSENDELQEKPKKKKSRIGSLM